MHYKNIVFPRELAQILVRFAEDSSNLVKLLRQVTTSSSGEKTIFFHELIKRMPGEAVS